MGMAGFAVYLVLVAGGNFVHNYYQLAVMPIAPVVITLGLVRLSERWGGNLRRRDRIIAAAMVIAASSTFIRSASANSWYEYSHDDVEACRVIGELSEPDERVMVVADSNPKWLFCADRKGWLLAPPDSTALAVQTAWREGARLAALPPSFEGDDVRRALAAAGTQVASTRAMDIYRLR
jgi:hypothetical protein